MKIKNFIGIALLLVLSLVYTWYEANRPQPVDWSETYSPKDKIPYGTYIVYRSLSELFPASKIRTSRLSVAEEFGNDAEKTAGTYIFVGLDYRIDALELKQLMQWVENGNNMFVAAEMIADTLLHTFSIESVYNSKFADSKLLFAPDHVYPFHKTSYSRYFSLPADFKGERLGIRINKDSTDFIRIPYGRGQVFLNLNPWAFTNHWVLDSICGDYYYKALSWLPDEGKTVIWDAYRTLGRQEVQTPLKVILQYPALKWALYLLLAGTLCYVLFRVRREQRPIPVIRPPENKMLGFIATVSSLYYKQKGHPAIALKLIDYFLGEVRTKYHLATDRLDEAFILGLSGRSGVDEEDTRKLILLIVKIKTTRQADEAELRKLVQGTELFSKKLNK